MKTVSPPARGTSGVAGLLAGRQNSQWIAPSLRERPA
jgi:hypothetical protein